MPRPCLGQAATREQRTSRPSTSCTSSSALSSSELLSSSEAWPASTAAPAFCGCAPSAWPPLVHVVPSRSGSRARWYCCSAPICSAYRQHDVIMLLSMMQMSGTRCQIKMAQYLHCSRCNALGYLAIGITNIGRRPHSLTDPCCLGIAVCTLRAPLLGHFPPQLLARCQKPPDQAALASLGCQRSLRCLQLRLLLCCQHGIDPQQAEL